MVLLGLWAPRVEAIDFPHNANEGIDCFSCHTWPWNPTDNLCLKCHDGSNAPLAVSHSSDSTSTKYGSWAIKCTTCHQQHAQDQYLAYGQEGLVTSGISDAGGITADSLTMSGANWVEDSFSGMILYPNLNNADFNYKIIGNTAETLTVKGPIDLAQVASGNTAFGILYGNLIRGEIMTPNSGLRMVRFFRVSGENSFADGNEVYDGICEVCHTQTSHHRNDGLAGQQSHYDGARCTSCHTHANGFGGIDHTAAGFVLPVETCLQCHGDGRPDLVAGVHGDQCGLCHVDPLGAGPLIEPYESTVPHGGSCTDCHDFNAVHGNVDHTATPGSGPILVFPDRGHDDAAWAYGQPAPHFDVTVECSACHTTEIPAAHGGDCSTCHPTPYDTLGTWERGCQQGGCHAVYHADSTTAHAAWEDSYDPNNDCNICHGSGWWPDQNDCLSCHASYGAGDKSPPVTLADVQAEYIGAAKIDFSIKDNGKVGIGRTFYRLNGGETTAAGKKLLIMTPGQYELEFWSVDQAGNTEAAVNTMYFTIFEDSTAPTTTSNAQSSYNKGTVITLSATDVSALGVKETYYRLNGGEIHTGTTVSIPGTIGTHTYTLKFWSEDWSGNIEAQNTATFTVSVPANGTIRLVWWDADVNPAHAPSAGEWASWTIRRGTTIVSRGSRQGPWSGVDNITLPVSTLPYTISVSYEYWEEEGSLYEEQTIFRNRYLTEAGQVIKLNY